MVVQVSDVKNKFSDQKSRESSHRSFVVLSLISFAGCPFINKIAMLAVLGFIATDFVRLPGDMYSFESIPRTIDAHDALLKTGPMYQLALWIGLWDLIVTIPACQAMGQGVREPGGKFPIFYDI